MILIFHFIFSSNFSICQLHHQILLSSFYFAFISSQSLCHLIQICSSTHPGLCFISSLSLLYLISLSLFRFHLVSFPSSFTLFWLRACFQFRFLKLVAIIIFGPRTSRPSSRPSGGNTKWKSKSHKSNVRVLDARLLI